MTRPTARPAHVWRNSRQGDGETVSLPADTDRERARRVGVGKDLHRALIVDVVVREAVSPVVDRDAVEEPGVIVAGLVRVVVARLIPGRGVPRDASVECSAEFGTELALDDLLRLRGNQGARALH